MGTRRQFSREFKVEAVKLVTERGVAVAQAARDLDVVDSAFSWVVVNHEWATCNLGACRARPLWGCNDYCRRSFGSHPGTLGKGITFRVEYPLRQPALRLVVRGKSSG